MNKRAYCILLVVLMSFILITTVGCRSKVKQSGFLADYPQLEEGPRGGVDLVYYKEGVDFKSYDKIMMDQVKFFFGENSKYKGIDAETLKELSEDFHKSMIEVLKDDYPLVSEAGPGVLRARFAITEVDSVTPGVSTITSVMPAGIAISFVKKGATGEHMNVGGATMEAEFLDAQTNERIALVIDDRRGKKYRIDDTLDKWGHAKDVFNTWAKLFREFLDDAHGK